MVQESCGHITYQLYIIVPTVGYKNRSVRQCSTEHITGWGWSGIVHLFFIVQPFMQGNYIIINSLILFFIFGDHRYLKEKIRKLIKLQPNIEAVFEEDNNVISFVTNETVEKGEELTISYLNPKMPYKERQQHLLLNYGMISLYDILMHIENY